MPKQISEHTLKVLEADQFGNIIEIEKHISEIDLYIGNPKIGFIMCENLIDNYFVSLNEKKINNLTNFTSKTVDSYERN